MERIIAPAQWRAGTWAGGQSWEVGFLASDVRISVATIERASRFTPFPDRIRWLVPLTDALVLDGQRLVRGEPITFDGDHPPLANIGDQAVRVVNVMWPREKRVSPQWRTDPRPIAGALGLAVFAETGATVRFADKAFVLAPAQCLFRSPSAPAELSGITGGAVVVTIDPW